MSNQKSFINYLNEGGQMSPNQNHRNFTKIGSAYYPRTIESSQGHIGSPSPIYSPVNHQIPFFEKYNSQNSGGLTPNIGSHSTERPHIGGGSLYQNNRANEIIRKYQNNGSTPANGKPMDHGNRVFSPHEHETVSPRQLDYNRQIVPSTAVGN